MKSTSLDRLLIEATVNRALRDMRVDSARQLRRLIDLAQNFTRGGNRKRFFAYAQDVMKNEHGAYYTALQALIRNVDRERIATFGINFGYTGCMVAAEQIRQNEKRFGKKIPWSSAIGLGDDCDASKVAGIVSDGCSLGQAVFMILVPDKQSLLTLGNVFSEHPACAFLLFVSPQTIDEEAAGFCNRYRNLFLSVDYDGKGTDEAATILHKKRLLYGFHAAYGDNRLQRLRNGTIQKYVGKAGGICAFLYPEEDCGAQTFAEVEHLVLGERAEQKYTCLCMDLYSDVAKINAIISEKVKFADCGKPEKPWLRAVALGEALLGFFHRQPVGV